MYNLALHQIELVDQPFAKEGMDGSRTTFDEQSLFFQIAQAVEKREQAVVICPDLDGLMTISVDDSLRIRSFMRIENHA